MWAGGDDWDAAIAEWLAEEHLKPQVREGLSIHRHEKEERLGLPASCSVTI